MNNDENTIRDIKAQITGAFSTCSRSEERRVGKECM